MGNTKIEVNIEKRELRKHLHDIKQECEQVAAYNHGRAVELEGEVRRLAKIIDEMQRREKLPNWRIMLDNESPFSLEIINTTIPRDFHFSNLKYSRKSDPLVHIERFNKGTRLYTGAKM